jgi:MFS family permease
VVVLLGLGFQIHLNIDSPRLFLHFARPADLELLMPVFWGGFSIAMVAAAPLVNRWGGLAVMGAGGLCAAAFAAMATLAGGLPALAIMQFGAGAAWGVVMVSAVAAALAIGAPGNEGRVTGMMYSALAVATFARLSIGAGGLAADPAYGAVFGWTPAAAWASGGVVLLALARLRPTRSARAPLRNPGF